jgi:hypothetical protein
MSTPKRAQLTNKKEGHEEVEKAIIRMVISYYISKKVSSRVENFFFKDFTNKLIKSYE